MSPAVPHIPLSGRTGIFLFSLSLFAAVGARAGETADSTATELAGVEVTASGRQPVRRGAAGETVVDTRMLGRLYRILGEPDPVRHIQMLPGVNVSDDYASGFSVGGTGYSHSLVSLDGAPVFFPYHFGGVFSIINPAYFRHVGFRRNIPPDAVPSRLASMLEAGSPREQPRSLSASLSAGLITSGLSLRVPLSDKVSLSAAGRISYIDLLYGPLLREGKNSYRYGLSDFNASLLFTPRDSDRILLAFHGNDDRLEYSYDGSLDMLRLGWANRIASLGWTHSSEMWSSSADAWYSSLGSSLGLSVSGSGVRSFSGVRHGGLRVRVGSSAPRRIAWSGGMSASLTQFRAPSVESSWSGASDVASGVMTASESKIFARGDMGLSDAGSLSADLALSLYTARRQATVMPSVSLSSLFHTGIGDLEGELSFRPQFMHQVCLSEIGLASNFWIVSDSDVPPASLLSLSAGWRRRFGDGAWEGGCHIYGSLVDNEIFYTGSVFDVMTGSLGSSESVSGADGFNTGVDLSVSRMSGPLTGMLSCSFGLSRRRFEDSPGRWLPSQNENLCTVKCFLSYRFDRHWEAGMNFRYSTGRPYTPVTEVYLLAGNLLMTYGDRNSERLPDYHRLDLSVTYGFRTGGRIPLGHSLNLSVMNVYGHRNAEFITYRYDSESREILRKTEGSLFRFLPSLSYTVEY
ncbi:MAG: TonB-dependent receptor [Muribaculaceae bacterium]|nr:TonB-dependent receptor [Muribaculaceae bacterium]